MISVVFSNIISLFHKLNVFNDVPTYSNSIKVLRTSEEYLTDVIEKHLFSIDNLNIYTNSFTLECQEFLLFNNGYFLRAI